MGSHFGEGSPRLGAHPMSIHDLSGQHRVPPNPNTPATIGQGRPTLPILGAPHMPANPLLAQFMKVHRHQLIKR